MSFMDSMQSLLDKVKQKGLFGQEEDQQMTSNMANGGFSGYRPATAKHRVTRDTTRQQTVQQDAVPEQQPAYDMGQQPMGGYQGMEQNPWQSQQTQYQQTGYQTTFQQTGYQGAFQQTGYQQPQYQQTGYQTAWQPQQPEFQQGWQDNGYTEPVQGMSQTGYQQSVPTQNNIVYMPGNFVDSNGRAYSHVERVAQLTQVSACYRIIEFMRNGESVIVNTEQINDALENQRCMDLLYGAAFAMNCTLTRISQKDIYLLSPATVMVVPYDSIRRMSDQDVNARWPEPEQTNDRYGFGATRPRESFSQRREYGRRSGYTNRYDDGFGSYQTAYAR